MAWSQAPKRAPAQDVSFTPPRKWALVIGANDYTELGPLTYAAGDASAFAKALVERFGFAPEAIELITDAAESKARPDIATVTAALDRQLADKRLDQGDLFIFYFSGHGVGTPTGDYLLPTDARKDAIEKDGLPVKEVVRRFVKAGLRNVLFIVDACRGGEKNTFGDDLRELGKQANIAVFLSCEPGTRSYEYPQLGHGAFTHFLLRALKSKSLPSPASGALWATKVIESVRTEVRDYTERDYPGRPQTPSGWSEATMDVLLGAFPERSQAKLKLADFQEEAKRLNREEYADALAIYGSELFDQNRYAEAVEVWRAGDGLRRVSPMERMNLSFALQFLGRTLEADNELAKLEKSDPDDIFTWISRIYNPSRRVTPAQRVEAAKQIWRLSKAEWAGYIVWASLQAYASDSDSQAFLKEFLAQSELAPRMRSYFEGFVLANDGKWVAAIEKWEATRPIAGPHPDEATIDTAVYQGLVMLGKVDRFEPFLKARTASELGRKAKWHLVLAAFYKEQKQLDSMMACVKTALEKELDPSDLLWIIRLVGLRFGEVAEALSRRADDFPFCWKAMLAKLWATKIGQGPQALVSALEEASKFCDDEFAVLYECMRFLDETLDEALELGRTTPEKYTQLMVAYSAVMAANVEKFGYDAETWILFNKFALISEKFEQILMLYDIYLGPQLAAGTLEPSLRAPYLMAALAMGDRAKVDRLRKLGGFHPSDTIDVGWLCAMDEALHGSLAKAKAMIPKAEPSATFGAGAIGFRAYLDAAEGKSPDLEAIVKAHGGDDAAMQFVGLAYVLQNRWDLAMPILREYAFKRQIGYFFLQATVAQKLFDRLRVEKRNDEADQVAYNAMISGYGNPLYRGIHFGSAVSTAAYAGTITLDGAEFEFIPAFEEGPLTLNIDSKGAVSGNFKVGPEIRKVSGQVDAYGNLKATIVRNGKTWRLTGKIAPPALYGKFVPLSTGAQAFLLLDSKGQARFLIGRTKRPMPPSGGLPKGGTRSAKPPTRARSGSR